MARVNPDADVILLEGDILLIEDVTKPQDPRGGKETWSCLLQSDSQQFLLIQSIVI
jgi:hypothetical protein